MAYVGLPGPRGPFDQPPLPLCSGRSGHQRPGPYTPCRTPRHVSRRVDAAHLAHPARIDGPFAANGLRAMSGYYSESLSAERLRLCYELAPPRVQRYLQAEIEFALSRIAPPDLVLELGCGYGRVLTRLIGAARIVVGIDTSPDSLRLARELIGDAPACRLEQMDATAMTFPDHAFDVVLCIQNGISAFGVDHRTLFDEAIRVTAPGGTILFSSYSPRFWDDRLEWFRIQSAHGLLGEIDEKATGDGVIEE